MKSCPNLHEEHNSRASTALTWKQLKICHLSSKPVMRNMLHAMYINHRFLNDHTRLHPMEKNYVFVGSVFLRS